METKTWHWCLPTKQHLYWSPSCVVVTQTQNLGLNTYLTRTSQRLCHNGTYRVREVQIADLTWHVLCRRSCVDWRTDPRLLTGVNDMALREKLVKIAIKIPARIETKRRNVEAVWSEKHQNKSPYNKVLVNRSASRKWKMPKMDFCKTKMEWHAYLSISFSLSQLKWLRRMRVIVAGF